MTGLLVNNPWMKMMSGVGGGSTNSNANGAEDEDEDEAEYSKPKAFADKRAIQSAQIELDEASDDQSEDDAIDRSGLKDVVDIIKGHEDEEDDVEEEKPEAEKELIESKEKVSDDFKDSNENKKRKSKRPKKLVGVEKVTVEEVSETNIQVLPMAVAQVVLVDEGESKAKVRNPAVQNNRERNAAAHSLTISEAFADDDVLEEFRAEKVSL